MADIVMNIAKGRVAELYNRVDQNDPAASALIVIPIETSGLESDATLKDKADLAAFLTGATNEQTTMGRKTLTDADVAAMSPDNTNDRMDLTQPTITWSGATGNPTSKMLFCYDADVGSGTDSSIIPLTLHDWAITPDGSDVVLPTGIFFRAS